MGLFQSLIKFLNRSLAAILFTQLYNSIMLLCVRCLPTHKDQLSLFNPKSSYIPLLKTKMAADCNAPLHLRIRRHRFALYDGRWQHSTRRFSRAASQRNGRQIWLSRKNRTMGPWLIWDEFHEIRRISCMKSAGFSWNQTNCMKSAGFHAWNPPDFMKFVWFHGKDFYNVYLYWFWWKIQHSVVYHEIRQISWWNPVDFMVKFGRFHAWNLADFMHEIWWISRNLADFMPRTLVLMKNTAFSGRPYCISVLVLKNKQKSSIHEIWQISWWNLADFMKSGKFHEIWQISWWNLADFMMKSGGFHPWNQADFMADLEKCKLFL